jgi:hypothetical protein
MRSKLTRGALAAAVVGAGMALAPAAQAELAIKPGSFAVTTTSDQAGAHPDMTTSFAFATDAGGSTDGNARNATVDLPVGFAGAPTAAQTCSSAQMIREPYGKSCPVNSQVGTVDLVINFGEPSFPIEFLTPVYNLVPDPGETALLGFAAEGNLTNIVISVRPGDHGVRAVLTNIPGTFEVDSSSLTLWGVPADPSHDAQRGEVCLITFGSCEGGERSAGVNPAPFLSNPTQCAGTTLTATLDVSSWQNPDQQETATSNIGPITGCEHVGFTPSLSVQPLVSQAGAPSEYKVDLKVPQNSDAGGLATADLRKAVVTLPQGVVLSPSAADGLEACTDVQVGLGALHESDPVNCPHGSQVGEATLTTPALPDKLTGGIYLAAPDSGPIVGPPYRIFLTLTGDGVTLKLVGVVQPDPVTGQLTTTFDEDPQLPFSDVVLRFNGGPRAPLANPSTCGAFTTTSDLTPWSAPFTFDASPSSTFETTGCRGPRFAPSFTAGTVNNQAGGLSPFTVTLSRGDSDQDFGRVTVRTPPGLLGMLSQIPLCPDAQASAGTCDQQSQIGHTTVGSGPGTNPFYLGGNVYLTGPYKGAPFGLLFLVHALAGPFDLGYVNVRATINVDPHTSALTVTSDPLPTILGGIPLQIRTINVNVDRSGFMFNPTDCAPLAIGGSITSTQGTTVSVSSRFQAADCAALPFKPKFAVLTQAKTSKAGGASLLVKLTQKPGEANIHRVDLQLPIALPSRLTTLQKACGETQFNTNAALCPAGSVIGTATAHTPVLQVPLTGPAYLVSHAGAAFPDVVFVLQGDERGSVIRIDLVGNTDIKRGITYSRFETVPDTPISSFETNLPEGPHSAFAANGNLCTQDLLMPTTLVGQNGAQVTQSTKIAVTGCHAVTIGNRKLSGKSVVLSFFLTAKGTVTVTGNGLKRHRKTLTAGSHEIKVALSSAGLTIRRHHRKIKIKVALRSGPKTSSATTTLSL